MRIKVMVLEVHQAEYEVEHRSPEEAKAYVEAGLNDGTLELEELTHVCTLPSELWKTEAVK